MIHGSLLLISPNATVIAALRHVLGEARHITVFDHLRSAFDHIYNNIPNLLIIDLHGDREGAELLHTLKEDPLFAHLPVLAILDPGDAVPDWQTFPVEDYIWHGDLERDAPMKVELCLARAERVVEANPLTRLPGNISINREIQNRLDRGIPFALAYADLDYFKPFNDKYGFSRGDEVIKITGRLLLNIVRNKAQQDYFVGHIGGDDFVCLMNPSMIEATCQEVIAAFDRIIPSFYDREDRESGHIQSRDRQGKLRRYPLLGISIGIAFAPKGAFSHYGAITSIASEMKHAAKKDSTSCYRMDRRIYTKPLEIHQSP